MVHDINAACGQQQCHSENGLHNTAHATHSRYHASDTAPCGSSQHTTPDAPMGREIDGPTSIVTPDCMNDTAASEWFTTAYCGRADSMPPTRAPRVVEPFLDGSFAMSLADDDADRRATMPPLGESRPLLPAPAPEPVGAGPRACAPNSLAMNRTVTNTVPWTPSMRTWTRVGNGGRDAPIGKQRKLVECQATAINDSKQTATHLPLVAVAPRDRARQARRCHQTMRTPSRECRCSREHWSR